MERGPRKRAPSLPVTPLHARGSGGAFRPANEARTKKPEYDDGGERKEPERNGHPSLLLSFHFLD